MDKNNKEIFISYAWGGESEDIVNSLDNAFRKNNLSIIRDKRDLRFKSLITDFMNKIGLGKAIVVVISDKYLKSHYCMYELLEIYKNSNFIDRIYPIIINDALIFEPEERIKYHNYWKEKKEKLDESIIKSGSDAIDVVGDDYKIYKRIYENIGVITNILKDINALTPQIHKENDYNEIISEIIKQFEVDTELTINKIDVIIPVNSKRLKKFFSKFWEKIFYRFIDINKKYATALRLLNIYHESEINKIIYKVFKSYIRLQYREREEDSAISYDFLDKFSKELDNKKSDNKYYLLLGESGTGKTTALLYLYARFAVASKNYSIYYARCTGDLLPLYSINKDTKEKCILLLDSFDESPRAFTNYEQFISEIETGTHEFAKVVISCRRQFFSGNSCRDVTNIKTENINFKYKYIFLSLIDKEEIRICLRKIFKQGINEVDNDYGKAINIVEKVGNLMIRPLIIDFIQEIFSEIQKKKIEISEITSYIIYTIIVNKWIERENIVYEKEEIHNDIKLNDIMLVLSEEIYRKQCTCDVNYDQISVLRLTQIIKENKLHLNEVAVRDRSLLSRSANSFYRFSHRTFKEYYYSCLLFDGKIDESSFNSVANPDAWKFYVEMCNHRMRQFMKKRKLIIESQSDIIGYLQEYKNISNIVEYVQEYKNILPCFAIHAFIHYMYSDSKFFEKKYLHRIFPDILQLNKKNLRLQNVLIEFSSNIIDNKNNILLKSDEMLEILSEHSVSASELDSLPFLLVDGDQVYHLYHRSFAEYLYLYDMLIENKDSYKDSLNNFSFDKLRFNHLFINEISYIRYIRHQDRLRMSADNILSQQVINEFSNFSDNNNLQNNIDDFDNRDFNFNYYEYVNKLINVDINNYIDFFERIHQSEVILLNGLKYNQVSDFQKLSLFANFNFIPQSDKRHLFVAKHLLKSDYTPIYITQADNISFSDPQLIFVEGGVFNMGDSNSMKADEQPSHKVEVNDFYISKYPVTNREFAFFIKQTGYITSAEKEDWSFSCRKVDGSISEIIKINCYWQFDEWGLPFGNEKDDFPVIHISWIDAINYCNYLNKRNSYHNVYDKNGNILTPEGKITTDISQSHGYRLPTEAEWEFAAGGGNKSNNYIYSGSNNINDVANYYNNEKILKCGSLKPNELGLYDMSGNVCECCTDWYSPDYYMECSKKGIISNPYNYKVFVKRVIRGGYWNSGCWNNDDECQIHNRGHRVAYYRTNKTGFRIVFVP